MLASSRRPSSPLPNRPSRQRPTRRIRIAITFPICRISTLRSITARMCGCGAPRSNPVRGAAALRAHRRDRRAVLQRSVVPEPVIASVGHPRAAFRAFGEATQPSASASRCACAPARARNTALDGMIARHAAANGLPVELVHRVVKRESGYNPRASSRGNIGLMQIRHGDRARHRLHRLGGRPARSGNQPHLCGQVSRGRLPGGRRQCEPCGLALRERLSRPRRQVARR